MGRVGRLAIIALGSIARIVAATTIFLPEDGDLPGLHTQGDSRVEATENAHHALELYIDVGDEDDPHRAWPGGGVPATRAVW